MDDAGYRCAMLGLDDQHVAAIAIAHDLILEISRRILSAKIRFERRPQARALFAQLRAREAVQRGTALGKEWRQGAMDDEARRHLFGAVVKPTEGHKP